LDIADLDHGVLDVIYGGRLAVKKLHRMEVTGETDDDGGKVYRRSVWMSIGHNYELCSDGLARIAFVCFEKKIRSD